MLEAGAAIFGVVSSNHGHSLGWEIPNIVQMFVGWLEFGLYFVRQNQVSWRFPIAFQAVFALTVMFMVPFLEESPR